MKYATPTLLSSHRVSLMEDLASSGHRTSNKQNQQRPTRKQSLVENSVSWRRCLPWKVARIRLVQAEENMGINLNIFKYRSILVWVWNERENRNDTWFNNINSVPSKAAGKCSEWRKREITSLFHTSYWLELLPCVWAGVAVIPPRASMPCALISGYPACSCGFLMWSNIPLCP